MMLKMFKILCKFYSFFFQFLKSPFLFLPFLASFTFLILTKTYYIILLKNTIIYILSIYPINVEVLWDHFITTYKQSHKLYDLEADNLMFSNTAPGEGSGPEDNIDDTDSESEPSLNDFEVGPNENMNPNRGDVKEALIKWADLAENINGLVKRLDQVDDEIRRVETSPNSSPGLYDQYNKALDEKDDLKKNLRETRIEYNIQERLIRRAPREL